MQKLLAVLLLVALEARSPGKNKIKTQMKVENNRETESSQSAPYRTKIIIICSQITVLPFWQSVYRHDILLSILLPFCWRISMLDINARAVRGEALLGSVPWPSTVKQMWGQMRGADGQPRLESLQPVGPSQPHNHRTGWSDRHNTHWEAISLVWETISQMLRMGGRLG